MKLLDLINQLVRAASELDNDPNVYLGEFDVLPLFSYDEIVEVKASLADAHILVRRKTPAELPVKAGDLVKIINHSFASDTLFRVVTIKQNQATLCPHSMVDRTWTITLLLDNVERVAPFDPTDD